jgi:hypothetical protein
MPKKITQIKPPNSSPHKTPSSQPLMGITCIAVRTAMKMLVKVMMMAPLRIEIHGSAGGKPVLDLVFLSVRSFFFVATITPEEFDVLCKVSQ